MEELENCSNSTKLPNNSIVSMVSMKKIEISCCTNRTKS